MQQQEADVLATLLPRLLYQGLPCVQAVVRILGVDQTVPHPGNCPWTIGLLLGREPMQGGQPLLVNVDRDPCADEKLTEAALGRPDLLEPTRSVGATHRPAAKERLFPGREVPALVEPVVVDEP